MHQQKDVPVPIFSRHLGNCKAQLLVWNFHYYYYSCNFCRRFRSISSCLKNMAVHLLTVARLTLHKMKSLTFSWPTSTAITTRTGRLWGFSFTPLGSRRKRTDAHSANSWMKWWIGLTSGLLIHGRSFSGWEIQRLKVRSVFSKSKPFIRRKRNS